MSCHGLLRYYYHIHTYGHIFCIILYCAMKVRKNIMLYSYRRNNEQSLKYIWPITRRKKIYTSKGKPRTRYFFDVSVFYSHALFGAASHRTLASGQRGGDVAIFYHRQIRHNMRKKSQNLKKISKFKKFDNIENLPQTDMASLQTVHTQNLSKMHKTLQSH